jgi:hypothetical protein
MPPHRGRGGADTDHLAAAQPGMIDEERCHLVQDGDALLDSAQLAQRSG